MAVQHSPVLARESLRLLKVRPGGTYVDCTVGLGGHAELILEQLQGKGELIGLDRDRAALTLAEAHLRSRFSNFRLFHRNFKELPQLLTELEINGFDGCLADLGLSSFQLDDSQRGFSFRFAGPLDMRMDRSCGVTAGELVNTLPEDELVDLFRRYGEEKMARRIAAAIADRRRSAPITDTVDLATIVEGVKGRRRGTRIHPATQVFQALRIRVNDELSGLETFFKAAVDLTSKGGRLAAISFHSLEDRIVKNCFRLAAGKCICFKPAGLCRCDRIQRVRILTPKPVVPNEDEVRENPRARSAKLRAVEKL
ncbi:MAG: 16S rRNA (cytosine(1402)-N(4))-methyltransferase RsmH [Acidobacteria bacterium]|nr:16S rRNA (cytosine(1402)-N(4))-methyltransferase RsmH [Acidobacteriota bacterium]